VNNAGAVASRLAVTPATGAVRGSYGVFYNGTVRLYFDGQPAATLQTAVQPAQAFDLNATVAVPAGASAASLLLYDHAGVLVDTLDRVRFTESKAGRPVRRRPGQTGFRLLRNTLLAVDRGAGPELTVAAVNGRVVMKAAGTGEKESIVSLGALAAGTYLVSARSGACRMQARIVLASSVASLVTGGDDASGLLPN